jgi:hypothetical protein
MYATFENHIKPGASQPGMLAGRNSSPSIRTRLERLMPEILANIDRNRLIEPTTCYEIVPVREIQPGRITLESGYELRAPLLAHRLANASHILFSVTTIGSTIAESIRKCFEDGKNIKAIFMEELANTALFEAADGLRSLAEERAAGMGLSASGPLSPGDFDGFGLDQQAVVLASAGAHRIGITMTRAGQMDPIHSVSTVIGLGREMRNWTRTDDCKSCRSHDRCQHYLRMLESAA